MILKENIIWGRYISLYINIFSIIKKDKKLLNNKTKDKNNIEEELMEYI